MSARAALYDILPVEAGDWTELVPLGGLAFKDEPVWNLFYPGLEKNDPEINKKHVERAIKAQGTSATELWMKVVDKASKEIAAAIAISIFDQVDPFVHCKDGEGVKRRGNAFWWEHEPTKQFFEFWINSRTDWRLANVDTWGPQLHIRVLHGNPKFFRRGAASAALQWAVDIADSKNLPAFLEATDSAYATGIYPRFGFQDVVLFSHSDTRPAATRSVFPEVHAMLMCRPAQGQSPLKKRQDQMFVFTEHGGEGPSSRS